MQRTTPLRDIIASMNATLIGPPPGDVAVGGVRYDSRRVEPGDLFVAVPGFHVDGHAYVAQALERAAAAVAVQADRRAAWEPQVAGHAGAPVIVVEDTRAALAVAAAAFFGWPARRLRVVGITGTDGKTTTSYLTSAVLEAAGHRTGLLGTVDFKIGDRAWRNDSRQTTPESPEVQELLAAMVDANVEYAIVESTSHGLELRRLDCCEYDVAVLTNVTSDHLDFHATREAYIAAKARLFAMLDAATEKRDAGIGAWAVLNAGDPAAGVMRAASKRATPLTYALDAPADLTARDVEATERGSRFVAVYRGEAASVSLALPGRFNVANALAAIAVGLTQGVPLAVAARGIASVAGVPGRMERIEAGQPFGVIVDYAHTEPALRSVLRELRTALSSANGRIILVFGAAGGRDAGRREGLGRAAAELADRFIITTEDPREEDPEAIIAQIAAAAKAAGRREGDGFVRVTDRRVAIERAITEARPGDLVLIAGKGHEGSIIVGRDKLPWDDRVVAREALAGRIAATSGLA